MAVSEEGRAVSDASLLAAITEHLAQFADYVAGSTPGFFDKGDSGVALVETAGGVCSPGPSGTLQCDLMRPLRLPAILVGDAKLGGISTTITAMDVLAMRGYDVIAVVVPDGGGGLGNGEVIALHPKSQTLHPKSYTLHPTPYTLHPTPYTLHPTP
jgi:dethiobiotin synthetase/adenosylmethionine--8-amino-7-oxononanoate aminotransferase